MTTLQEWRATRQRVWTLPACGLEVTTRKVDLFDLVVSGQIPETLDTLAKRAAKVGFGIEDLQEFMPLIDLTVKLCLVAPLPGEQADAEHVRLDEIPISDRMEIFNWANGVAADLAPFRRQPPSDVEPAPAGHDVPQPAE
jgi:hypothetical protein